jgi:uncharacterized protein YutE (UPF0331/DUF86 family)
MSDKSPLFVSALELLAHATELYSSGESRKHKFTILHLANAVELVLKDCLIDHGVSIYKGPKETITIWGTFDELAKVGVCVKEKPVIELLIDDRNTIQHRFGYPNGDTVFYYLEQVVGFFERFLSEQYGVILAEALQPHMSRDNLALIGLVNDEYSHLRKLMQLSPDSAVMEVYKAVESATWRAVSGDRAAKVGLPMPNKGYTEVLMRLIEAGYLEPGIQDEFDSLRQARNQAAHATLSDKKLAQKALDTAVRILSAIEKAEREGLFNQTNRTDGVTS